jgi:hypothetical protein
MPLPLVALHKSEPGALREKGTEFHFENLRLWRHWSLCRFENGRRAANACQFESKTFALGAKSLRVRSKRAIHRLTASFVESAMCRIGGISPTECLFLISGLPIGYSVESATTSFPAKAHVFKTKTAVDPPRTAIFVPQMGVDALGIMEIRSASSAEPFFTRFYGSPPPAAGVSMTAEGRDFPCRLCGSAGQRYPRIRRSRSNSSVSASRSRLR